MAYRHYRQMRKLDRMLERIKQIDEAAGRFSLVAFEHHADQFRAELNNL